MSGAILLTAMRSENPRRIPAYEGHFVIGVGPAKAARSLERIIAAERPDRVVLTGFCGAVDPDLLPGDLFIPDEIVCGGLRGFVSAEERRELLLGAESLPMRHATGILESFDAPVLSREGVGPGTAAVDMESHAVLRVAREHGIPVSIIKVVSDLVPQSKPFPLAFFRFLLRAAGNYRLAKSNLDAFFVSFRR